MRVIECIPDHFVMLEESSWRIKKKNTKSWFFMIFNIFLKIHVSYLMFSHFESFESLNEPCRQWLGWQFTDDKYQLPGDRTIVFCKLVCYLFCLGQSCGRPRHPVVSWNISTDDVWRLYNIEKVYCLTLWRVDFLKCLKLWKSILNHMTINFILYFKHSNV